MRVLVLGANGFIGSAVVAALHHAGLGTRAAIRDTKRMKLRFPDVKSIGVDLRDPVAHDPGFWSPALDGVDAVVNAAGVLQPRRDRDAWAVHLHAPAALYTACARIGVRRVIHVSAIGVEEAETVYARSKLAGERALGAAGLDWTILRPAVVFGDGSYGGTSLLRAIAGFPGLLPTIGDGRQPIDFIHKDDLAIGVVRLLETGSAVRSVLEPAGPERTPLSEVLSAYRAWLGIKPAPTIAVPLPLVGVLARIGDIVKLEPITTTALAQLRTRLIGDAAGFTAATGIVPRTLRAALAERPAESQDLWHARLYLLRPLVRLALALVWLVSGVLGIAADPARYAEMLRPLVDNIAAAHMVGMAAGILDLAIAAALIIGWRTRHVATVQFVVVIGYTAGLTMLSPGLWADLYGGLLKNVAFLALIAVHRALEEER